MCVFGGDTAEPVTPTSSVRECIPHSVYCDRCCCCCKSLQSCPTLCDPIDGQPTRFPHPWESPGKNTGVGCHFLLQSMNLKSEREVTQLCPTLSDPMDCSLPGSSIHGFAKQEYWSRVPSPSPGVKGYIYL